MVYCSLSGIKSFHKTAIYTITTNTYSYRSTYFQTGKHTHTFWMLIEWDEATDKKIIQNKKSSSQLVVGLSNIHKAHWREAQRTLWVHQSRNTHSYTYIYIVQFDKETWAHRSKKSSKLHAMYTPRKLGTRRRERRWVDCVWEVFAVCRIAFVLFCVSFYRSFSIRLLTTEARLVLLREKKKVGITTLTT